MFNKDEKSGLKEVETVIGPSVKVKGEFNGNGNIIIEGVFEGSLKTTNGLYVGDKAKVTADIEAKEATIGGEVVGNTKVDGHLEVTSTARISGDIESLSLSIAKGAVLNGKCTMAANRPAEKKPTN
jgi:cytoskeletal protein CcmA (bactofilin family)